VNTAILVRRYKRFLADIELPDGKLITIHCPNTGSMTNCAIPGSRIWYSTSANKKRKYPHTWELVEAADGELIGVNTIRANQIVRSGIESGIAPELADYSDIKAEVRFGEENSRIDLLLSSETAGGNAYCYVEIKSVTLLDSTVGSGIGLFPDAKSQRGIKHLRELIRVVNSGHRAVLFYCAQHTGIREVRPADNIDPEYGRILREARDVGVELLAYAVNIDPPNIVLQKRIPVVCP
jgi:sugar fermentation stimulation protein A